MESLEKQSALIGQEITKIERSFQTMNEEFKTNHTILNKSLTQHSPAESGGKVSEINKDIYKQVDENISNILDELK